MICTALWSVQLYDLYRFMICTDLWSVPLYDLYRFMICTDLWSVPLYDLYRFMICTALWSVPLYDLYRFMICTALWSVPIYDLYRFMICTALWSVPLYDLHHFMICTALWSAPLYDLYRSPNITRVFKYRKMRWASHVARMGDNRGTYRVLLGHLMERDHFVRPGLREEDDIKTHLQEVEWGNRSWSALAHYKECANEPSGSIKCGEFLDWLRTCQILRNYSAPWRYTGIHSDTWARMWKARTFPIRCFSEEMVSLALHWSA